MEMERSRFAGYRRIVARGRHITLTFDPKLTARYQRPFPGFDEKIVSKYSRGMTVREIQGCSVCALQPILPANRDHRCPTRRILMVAIQKHPHRAGSQLR